MTDLNEFDDLDNIESQGLSKNEINLSSVYNVKVGGFGSSKSIATYLCSLNINNLAEDISLYETLSRDKSWPVSQIIQREVDKVRVSNISKDYVLGEGRDVKYFPPLIVAILPVGEDGKIGLKMDFNPDNSSTIKQLIFDKSNYRNNSSLNKYFLASQNKSLINGLYLLEVSKVFDFNIFCWDKSKYYSIVIDGQHRLDSLLKSKDDNPSIEDYVQDVVFLDFSLLIKEFNQKYTPVEVVRRIFIDINTNAKRVNTVRQILMDDKDLASLFVQSLVDSVYKNGNDKPENVFIPSLLVDWYGDSLKHTLPHLTGILSLYQILSDYLILYNLTSINDRRSPFKVKNWVKRVNDYFLVDKQIVEHKRFEEVKTLSESLEVFNTNTDLFQEEEDLLEDEFKETSLFNYDYRTLEIAQEVFEKLYAKSIVKFFNNFQPYSEVKRVISEQKGFDEGSILNTALLSSRNKIKKSKSLKSAISDIKIKLESEFNERYFLMYTVLGQKAVFSILFKRIFTVFNKDITEEKCIAIVDNFLNDINAILDLTIDGSRGIFGKRENLTLTDLSDDLTDLGTVATSFWEGIIYEDNKIIYNSQGIQSLSSFIEYVIVVYNKLKEDDKYDQMLVINFQEQRIKRILKKRFDSLSDSEIKIFTNQIIEAKQEFIISTIRTALLL